MLEKSFLEMRNLVELMKHYKNDEGSYDEKSFCLVLMVEVVVKEVYIDKLIALWNQFNYEQVSLKDDEIILIDEYGGEYKYTLWGFYNLFICYDNLMQIWEYYYYTKELKESNPLFEFVHEVGYKLDTIKELASKE